MDFWDYSPAASGMRYSNDRNPAGVVIDGSPDTPASGAPLWEKVGGPQGTVTHVPRTITNISGLSQTNYYFDDATDPSPVTQCTGDAVSYGSSGNYITGSIPVTDPHLGNASSLQARDSMYYEAPAQPVSVAQKHNNQIRTPLTYSASAFRG